MKGHIKMYKVQYKQGNKTLVQKFYKLNIAYDFFKTSVLFEGVKYSKLYLNDVLLESYKKE